MHELGTNLTGGCKAGRRFFLNAERGNRNDAKVAKGVQRKIWTKLGGAEVAEEVAEVGRTG